MVELNYDFLFVGGDECRHCYWAQAFFIGEMG